MFALLKPLNRVVASFAKASALAAIATASLVSSAQAQSSDMDVWLDESGQFKIEAKFMGISDGNVNLQTKDGKTKSVPYAKLSLSSQFKAKKLSDPKAFEAPPLPSSYAPPPLPADPFPADATIEQYLDTLYGQLKEGHAEITWYAMPPKMRAELEALIAKGADVVGPNTFRQLQAVLPNVLTIVRDKRSFIVGHPLIAAKPEIAKALNQGLPALEPVVELMTKKSTWSSENFKEGKVGPWIMLFANDMMRSYNKALPALRSAFGKDNFPSLQDEKYKVLEKTADSAKVEITGSSKKKQVVTFKKVDGFWVQDGMEKALEQFAEARGQLESMDQSQIDTIRTQVKGGLAFVNGILGSLAKAKTQQEFNAILDPFVKQITSMQPGGGMAGMSPGMSSSGMTPGMQMTPGMSGSSAGMPNSGGVPDSSGVPPNFKQGKNPAELGAGL